MNLDVLRSRAPVPGKLQRDRPALGVLIGHVVGTMRRSDDPGAVPVGHRKPGGAGVALAVAGMNADDPRSPNKRQIGDRAIGQVEAHLDSGQHLGALAKRDQIGAGRIERTDQDDQFPAARIEAHAAILG